MHSTTGRSHGGSGCGRTASPCEIATRRPSRHSVAAAGRRSCSPTASPPSRAPSSALMRRSHTHAPTVASRRFLTAVADVQRAPSSSRANLWRRGPLPASEWRDVPQLPHAIEVCAPAPRCPPGTGRGQTPSDRRGQSVPSTVPDSTLWHVGKAWLRTHVLIARVRGTMDGIVASVKTAEVSLETLNNNNIVVCTQFNFIRFIIISIVTQSRVCGLERRRTVQCRTCGAVLETGHWDHHNPN